MSHFDLDCWITAAKVATLTPTNDQVPSLVEELTGERVRGSWWSHPRAHLIYDTYQQMVAADFVLTVKLIERKVTFVHQDLWAPILAAVMDHEWRQAARARLTPLALKLLNDVEGRGTLLLTPSNTLALNADSRSLRKAKNELERGCLVISGDRHTNSGTHAPYLESWSHFQLSHADRSAPRTARHDALRTIRLHTGTARLAIDD